MITKRDILFTPKEQLRALHIYLPDNYDQTNERYPVMYFFDGHNLFFDEYATYGKSWGLKEFLDQWEKPMIIVGIECGHEGDERLSEYCPYTLKNHKHFGNINGIGDQTVQWIIDELKPMIDRDYRTLPQRECTAIAGSSMGGLMSLYAVVCHNDVFSKAACLSSTVSICQKALKTEIETASLSPDTRIYMSWGTDELKRSKEKPKYNPNSYMARCNGMYANKLDAKGVVTRLYCQNGGQHCEADWEKQNEKYMNFLWME